MSSAVIIFEACQDKIRGVIYAYYFIIL